MNGALAIAGGLLLVGRHVRRGEVSAYDLDGARMGPGFTFAGLDGGAARVSGLALDVDRRIFVADGAARAVRRFTMFGVELEPLARSRQDADVAGEIAEPASVAVSGVELDARVVVASRGARRHALATFDGDGRLLASLRPRGDPQGSFEDVVRVARRGSIVAASERGSGIVSIFKDGEFHFALRAPRSRHAGADAELRAAVPVADDRFVLAIGGERDSALVLVDGTGRVVRRLAESGTDTGAVFEPTDVVVDEGASERTTRVFVIDRDGDRVSVFTLAGTCYGAFADPFAVHPDAVDPDVVDPKSARAPRRPPES